MKEFSAQTGGRYTYADDLENLQELALAFAQLFDDCDNFIMSGCEVASGAISAGYVFLNGRIRYFSGATGISSWPQYIYELNTTESVPYESGGSKVGRNIYGCAMAKAVPVVTDELTGKTPQFIPISATGGLRMKDAFIGKYALLLNPANGSQTVNSAVNFAKAMQANSDFIAKKNVTVQSGALKTMLSYNGSTFNMESIGGIKRYRLSMTDGVGFRFYVNDTLIATIGNSVITFSKPIAANQGTFGGLILSGNSIYQGTANSVADLYINRYGYNGGTTQYRNTHIGNGKGVTIFSVTGANGYVDMFGRTQITAGTLDALVLKASVVKDNNTLTNAIAWKDSTSTAMARIGFLSTSNQLFSIAASAYNIAITGNKTVNIGPAIMENGQLLSEKYVLQTKLTEALNKKANSNEVYSITKADEKFAMKNGGLSQFVTATTDAAACRGHIGAVGTSDLTSYAKIGNYLSDMAKTDADKKKIRDNIGAAAVGDFQPKLSDSGWINIKESLYARQIGNMVCVQGSIKTIHSGTVFSIPNSIAAPTHAVKVTIAFANNRSWVCKIAKGQRACTVVYCDSSCGKSTEFSLTYMV